MWSERKRGGHGKEARVRGRGMSAGLKRGRDEALSWITDAGNGRVRRVSGMMACL